MSYVAINKSTDYNKAKFDCFTVSLEPLDIFIAVLTATCIFSGLLFHFTLGEFSCQFVCVFFAHLPLEPRMEKVRMATL